MAFFAQELGLPADDWRRLEADYRARTRQLFDPDGGGRYRDWLIAERRFQEPCPDNPYWGVDACRDSAQSLTPLLIGEPLPEPEIWRHYAPPWTLWPSWTISLVESAAAAGHYGQVGALARDTIERVYAITTRRELASLERPLPGSSPEFWPSDWRTYGGSDAYGWGATTANLLIRHLIGFKESRDTDGWVADLTPALPPDLLEVGRRYSIHRLLYRGLVVDLTYIVQPHGLLVELDLGRTADEMRECTVEVRRGSVGETIYDSVGQARQRHRFEVSAGRHYQLRLR
jgi:hypothetical protein